MALLHLMVSIGQPVRVFHLHHGVRDEADSDADFVRRQCADVGVACHIERAELSRGAGFEARARTARYDCLNSLAAGGWAATAHTMDDQAETVLLRLLRGAGARGLGGIHPLRSMGCTLVRPFLAERRSALRTWLLGRGIPWCEDITNRDVTVPRNRIRHHLLPLLETYNPRIVEALARTADLLRDDDACLESYASHVGHQPWQDVPSALRGRLVRRVAGLSQAELQQIHRLENLPPGATFEVGGRSYHWTEGRVELWEPPAAGWGPYELSMPGTTPVPELGGYLQLEWVETVPGDDRSGAFVRGGVGGLHVRSRRRGDRFYPIGMAGSKKVKNFFIDEKVPRYRRDTIPLLVSSAGALVCIVGMQTDRRFQVRPGDAGAWRIRLVKGGEHLA